MAKTIRFDLKFRIIVQYSIRFEMKNTIRTALKLIWGRLLAFMSQHGPVVTTLGGPHICYFWHTTGAGQLLELLDDALGETTFTVKPWIETRWRSSDHGSDEHQHVWMVMV